jgi:glycosyltransferase involved in cell wall biosynthesis
MGNVVMKKTLSVVMPNYNYSNFLKKSLISVLNQTRKPDKLIIIDDASTDNSLEIIEGFIKNIPNVIFLKNPSNKGVVYSINRGLSFVSTDYVYFISSDDILSYEFIDKMMQFVEKNTDISICTSIPAFFKSSNEIWIDDLNVYQEKVFKPLETVKLMKKKQFWVASHSSIIKTSELKKESLDEKLKYYSDWFWVLNIALKNKIGFIPEPLAFMRIHNTSYSGKKKKYMDLKKIFSTLMNKIENEESILKNNIIRSRALSSLDRKLMLFLIKKINYWKYLPGVIFGKCLYFYNRIIKKIKKELSCKVLLYNFDNIKNILEKDDF